MHHTFIHTEAEYNGQSSWYVHMNEPRWWIKEYVFSAAARYFFLSHSVYFETLFRVKYPCTGRGNRTRPLPHYESTVHLLQIVWVHSWCEPFWHLRQLVKEISLDNTSHSVYFGYHWAPLELYYFEGVYRCRHVNRQPSAPARWETRYINIFYNVISWWILHYPQWQWSLCLVHPGEMQSAITYTTMLENRWLSFHMSATVLYKKFYKARLWGDSSQSGMADQSNMPSIDFCAMYMDTHAHQALSSFFFTYTVLE